MGILSDLGPVENFEEIQKQQKALKRMTVRQFLHLIQRFKKWRKSAQNKSIKWGIEIEGHFLKFDDRNRLELFKEAAPQSYRQLGFLLTAEYGSWMFEMVPTQPFNTRCNFSDVITSINEKYVRMNSQPRMILTIPGIPFLGMRDSSEPLTNNEITQSKYIDDSHVTKHPRFECMEKHIRMRRGASVNSFIPLFKDKNTNSAEIAQTEPKPDFINIDSVTAGLGHCCLQVTTSTIDLDHARYVYDQLNIMSPIFMALSAGTPFLKGKLSDWDVRWRTISLACDDRNEQQRNQSSPNYIPTSRYSEANYYLWNNSVNRQQYNNVDTGVKEEDIAYIHSIENEENIHMDNKLAFHLANVIKRDFMIVHQKFKDLGVDEPLLFEMINGTNWSSVRLKIPTEEIGWRVELRTMEVQLTADENTALSILSHLLIRLLHENLDLNFYIPITLLMENFNRAHKINALINEKFFFRTNIYDEGLPEIEELTIGQIFFGKGVFRGLFHQFQKKVEGCAKECTSLAGVVLRIKKFLFDKFTGERVTLANWMRKYVDEHPAYTHNSIMNKEVMDDLLIRLHKISIGEIEDSNFKRIFADLELEDLACVFDVLEKKEVLVN